MAVIAANHRNICQFSDANSSRYRPVWKAIQALCTAVVDDPASCMRPPLARAPPVQERFWAEILYIVGIAKQLEMPDTNLTNPFFLVPFSRDPHFVGRQDLIACCYNLPIPFHPCLVLFYHQYYYFRCSSTFHPYLPTMAAELMYIAII